MHEAHATMASRELTCRLLPRHAPDSFRPGLSPATRGSKGAVLLATPASRATLVHMPNNQQRNNKQRTRSEPVGQRVLRGMVTAPCLLCSREGIQPTSRKCPRAPVAARGPPTPNEWSLPWKVAREDVV